MREKDWHTIDLNQAKRHIKEMYEGANTSVNNQRRYIGEEFPMTIGLNLGFALKDKVPCLLFADDIVLTDKTARGSTAPIRRITLK